MGCGQPNERDFASELRGRFVLDSAECAGWEFVNSNILLWRNDDLCLAPDTFLITWLDERTFVAKSTYRYHENCPPLVWVEQVERLDENELELTDVWTGWSAFRRERSIFRRWVAKE